MMLNGDSDYYEPPEFFVTDDMKIEEKLIQSYISTGNIGGLIKDDWEREIKSSIKENLTGDVADEMDELGGRSDSEIDSLVDAVFDSEKYNIARAIASALKQAIGYDLNEIDDDYYDELPGIEVVWTGDLSDVGPNDDSGLQEKLHIWQPHFIFSHPTGEVVSDPVRLHGQYVIDLPSREDRCNGAESRILDDMSSRRTRRFDYTDGVGLSQYSAADVYHTFE